MKRIFLTGASSGIGLAIAQTLLARRHEVWGTSRHPDRLPRLERFHPVQLDLRNPGEIEKAFKSAFYEAGHFEVVINNAGSGHFGPAEFLSETEIFDQFQIVFLSHVRLMQLALAEMRPRNSGLIINITSLAARLPVPFMAAYNAAKSAMASFTLSIQLELANSGIHVVDLQPGDISTNFNDVIATNNSGGAAQAKVWQAVDRNMKKAPKPELVASHVVKLIGERNPPPRVTVGDSFQALVAPFIFRFLPQRLRIWGLKQYYGI